MQKLASIEKIISVRKHPNADSLSICKVLGYESITRIDQFKAGDVVVYIQPDCVLPDEEWAQFYKSKSNRTKAIKLRGEWSQGIIEPLSVLMDNPTFISDIFDSTSILGTEVSGYLNIKKYEVNTELLDKEIAGCLPYGLFKTDEERWENINRRIIVTLKIDGTSASYGCKTLENDKDLFMCQRSYRVKSECGGIYAAIEKKYNIFEKLKNFSKDICIRGEIYGNGIQKFSLNPHCKLPLDFAVYNILDLNTLKYLPFEAVQDICKSLEIPTVPILETCNFLSYEIVMKYSQQLEKINDQPFEGVVMKFDDGSSFKIINKHYDSKK